MGGACTTCQQTKVIKIAIQSKTPNNDMIDSQIEDALLMNFHRLRPFVSDFAGDENSKEKDSNNSLHLVASSGTSQSISTITLYYRRSSNTINVGKDTIENNADQGKSSSESKNGQTLGTRASGRQNPLTKKHPPGTGHTLLLGNDTFRAFTEDTVPAGKSLTRASNTSRKISEILNKVISLDHRDDQKRFGRQSRLMHADRNTVVSIGVSDSFVFHAQVAAHSSSVDKSKKRPRRKVIMVKPCLEADDDRQSATSPGRYPKSEDDDSSDGISQLHVCKHGIPIAEDPKEKSGCAKCQRPCSRDRRALQEVSDFRRAEKKMKRKKWAKRHDRLDLHRKKEMDNSIDRALRDFAERNE